MSIGLFKPFPGEISVFSFSDDYIDSIPRNLLKTMEAFLALNFSTIPLRAFQEYIDEPRNAAGFSLEIVCLIKIIMRNFGPKNLFSPKYMNKQKKAR